MHVANRDDISELEVEKIPLDWFDLIITAESDVKDYSEVAELLKTSSLALQS